MKYEETTRTFYLERSRTNQGGGNPEEESSAPDARSQKARPAQLELGQPLAVVEEHVPPSGLDRDLGAGAQAVPQVGREKVVHLHHLAVHLPYTADDKRGVWGVCEQHVGRCYMQVGRKLDDTNKGEDQDKISNYGHRSALATRGLSQYTPAKAFGVCGKNNTLDAWIHRRTPPP